MKESDKYHYFIFTPSAILNKQKISLNRKEDYILTKKAFAILLLLTLLFTTVSPAFAQTAISNEAEDHILNELNRANIPNAAVAVIQGGETSYILKDSEYDTLFQIGSISKSFTGFGVLLLEDMGLLSVSDTVNHHLPWFEVRYNGVSVPHNDITIYNLFAPYKRIYR